MLSFHPHTLSTLLFCALCLGTSCNPAIKEVKPREVHNGYSALFQHRHFFGYELDQPGSEPTAFHILNTNDLFSTSSTKPDLAAFHLRAKGGPPKASSPISAQLAVNPYRWPDPQTHSDYPRLTPNTTDKETVVNLAKMTSDAYLFDPNEPDWLNTSLGFNFTSRFGWRGDGLRGHVFTTEDYSTVIVAFKGTTVDPLDKRSGKDRINDNKLFSCCCGAQHPYFYPPVCNCWTGYYQCNSTCLTRSLLQNDSYYDAAMYVMQKIQAMYPHATFWTVGHSLGGSLASLIGLTLNIPAVTFEAPPERLPAERIGLLPANSTTQAQRAMTHHFGNTADPIYMSACNGFFSSCSLWGFSFESRCFAGRKCVYDTVSDKGWRLSIANHRINHVIENVLKAYDEVPTCETDEGCVDCFNWKSS